MNETSESTEPKESAETGGAMRALEAIEWITADDFTEDLEMRIAFGRKKIPKDLVTACEKLCKIYAIAHAEIKTSCHHVHDDWRKIKDEVLESKSKRESLISSGNSKPKVSVRKQ